MKFQFQLIFSALAILLLFSCKREIQFEGPKGDMKGSIKLVDGHTLTDASGVLVSLEESSPHLQTTTNAAGEWTFTNLSTGIYNLVFSKDSFASFRVSSFQFVGGNVPYYLYPANLYKLPYPLMTDFKIDTISNYFSPDVEITMTTRNTIQASIFRFFISEFPDVSYSNYETTFYSGAVDSSPYNTRIPGNILSKFKKRATLYIICYPCISNQQAYTDMITGNQIYGVNPDLATPVVSFSIPYTIY